MPLTWGGTRRAALEFDRTFKSGPLTRIESSVGIWNRENPHFDIDDQTGRVNGRAERQFAGAPDGVSGVAEHGRFRRHRRSAVDARRRRRVRHAARPHVSAQRVPARRRLDGAARPQRTGPHRSLHDGSRAATSAFHRQVVVRRAGPYTAASAPLPAYERLLLGGASTLRGFRTGTFDGDRTLVTSAELRVPITSVLSGARLGVTAFFDAGKAWNFGERVADADWHQRRRRRPLPDRPAREAEPGRRPRPERRRHARPPVVGFAF